MTDIADSTAIGLDPFDQAYRQVQRRYVAGLGIVAAAACIMVAFFAWITSLPVMRDAALVVALTPLPFLILGLLWRGQDEIMPRRLQQSLITSVVAWLLVAAALGSDGLALAYERELHEIEPMEYSVATAATADSEQDAIWAAIKRAQEQPSPATFRALVPYLDRVQTDLVMPDGSLRNTSSVVREVLWADTRLLFRSLDEEARAMAALLPADNVVPQEMTIRVAERLEFALKTLITAHSEVKIQTSFDVPSVGINIQVEAEAGTDAGGDGVSNREIGITYPYGEAMPGDVVFVNAATVDRLLKTVRKELGY